MLECDCTSKHLKRKKMQPPKPKSKIYLEISVSHSFCTKMYKQFWWRSAPAKTVDTWGISFRNICFAMFFPFLNGGRDPSNIALRMPPEELACISQEKEWRNYSRKRQRVMKEFPPKKNQACNASHFQKLWFCPFPGIWHRFRATLRMCPTFSFCVISFTCPSSIIFQ